MIDWAKFFFHKNKNWSVHPRKTENTDYYNTGGEICSEYRTCVIFSIGSLENIERKKKWINYQLRVTMHTPHTLTYALDYFDPIESINLLKIK